MLNIRKIFHAAENEIRLFSKIREFTLMIQHGIRMPCVHKAEFASRKAEDSEPASDEQPRIVVLAQLVVRTVKNFFWGKTKHCIKVK